MKRGEFLAHTFVPGIPEEILADDPTSTETVERHIPGMGDFVEVGSPILAGVAGTVHVGMDTDVIALKVQRAIGRQLYLVCIIFAVGVAAAIWFVNLAARPLGDVLAYAVALARNEEDEVSNRDKILERKDEAGHLARLFPLFRAGRKTAGGRSPDRVARLRRLSDVGKNSHCAAPA